MYVKLYCERIVRFFSQFVHFKVFQINAMQLKKDYI